MPISEWLYHSTSYLCKLFEDGLEVQSNHRDSMRQKLFGRHVQSFRSKQIALGRGCSRNFANTPILLLHRRFQIDNSPERCRIAINNYISLYGLKSHTALVELDLGPSQWLGWRGTFELAVPFNEAILRTAHQTYRILLPRFLSRFRCLGHRVSDLWEEQGEALSRPLNTTHVANLYILT